MERSFGLFNSQHVMLSLVEKGMNREDAYAIVQKNAMESWRQKRSFLDLLVDDQDIRKCLLPDEIKRLFDIGYYLRHIDYLFERVFGKNP
jgi:adenylosuccinate lyase